MPDYTDSYAKEKNLYIYIEHVPTGEKVKFKALLKAFSDNFDSNWNSEEVYGRMDPIQTFQGTKRVIEFEWEVVSYDIYEAEENLYNTDKLANFLYPVYADYDNSNSIVSAPVLKIKLSNLISQPGAPAASADGGLVGRLDGFRYTPDFESGVFFGRDKTMYPQTIAIQGSFHVFHTHDLGWNAEGKLRTKKFPHGAGRPRHRPPLTAASLGPRDDDLLGAAFEDAALSDTTRRSPPRRAIGTRPPLPVEAVDIDRLLSTPLRLTGRHFRSDE